jgi:ABC-type Na+ efflux pump permease subunit
LRIVFAIWKKDLVDAAVNLRLLASIAMPVFMSVLFGALFGGLRGGDVPASLVGGPGPASVVPVYDAGESQIPQLLDASESFDVRFVASPEEMKNALVDGHLNAGLILPPGFDAALMEGGQPALQLMVNPQQGDGGMALQAWLTHALWERTNQPFPSVVVIETLAPKGPSSLSQRQEQMALWLVMSLVTAGVYVVPALLVEEKQSRTLNAVLTTPAGYGELVLAKAGVGLIYSLLSSGLILALNEGMGNNVGLVIGAVFLGALVLVGLGLLLGGLFDDMSALNTWGTVAMLVLMLPGALHGLLVSGLFRLSVLQWGLRPLPTYHVLEAVYAALSDQIVPERITLNLALLAGMAISLFCLVVVRLRRRAR